MKREYGVEEKSIQRSVHDISVSIAKTQEVMEARQHHKMKLTNEQLAFEKEDYWMIQASALFGKDSNEMEEELELAGQLLTKRTLASLTEMCVVSSAATENKYEHKGWLEAQPNEECEDINNVQTQPPPWMGEDNTNRSLLGLYDQNTQHATRSTPMGGVFPIICDNEVVEE